MFDGSLVFIRRGEIIMLKQLLYKELNQIKYFGLFILLYNITQINLFIERKYVIAPIVTSYQTNGYMLMNCLFMIIIGFYQILAEKQFNTEQFLIFRPVKRWKILFIKIIAGFIIQFLSVILPFFYLIIYSIMPGNVPAPFRWEMCVEILHYSAFVIPAFYFAAIASAVNRGRWYGTRLAPLAVIILTVYFVNHIIENYYVSLLYMAAIGIIVSNSAFFLFSNPVEAEKHKIFGKNIFAKFCLIFNSIIFFGVIFLIIFVILIFFLRNNECAFLLNITDTGEIRIEKKDFKRGKTLIYNEKLEFQSTKEEINNCDTDILFSNYINMNLLANSSLNNLLKKWHYYGISKEVIPLDSKTKNYIYLIPEENIFEVYRLNFNEIDGIFFNFAGYIGKNGLQTIKNRAIPFAVHNKKMVLTSSQTNKLSNEIYFQTENGLFLLNSRTLDVSILFENHKNNFNEIIKLSRNSKKSLIYLNNQFSFKTEVVYENSFKPESAINPDYYCGIDIKNKKIEIFEIENIKNNFSIDIPENVKKNKNLNLLISSQKNIYLQYSNIVYNGTEYTISGYTRKGNKFYDKKIIVSNLFDESKIRDRMFYMVIQPGILFYFKLMKIGEYSEIINFDFSNRKIFSGLIISLCLSILLFGFIHYFSMSRWNLSIADRVIWFALFLIFPYFTPFAYFFTFKFPQKIKCPVCLKKRRMDLKRCVFCGADDN